MPRTVLSIATVILAISTAPAQTAMPDGAAGHAAQVAQAAPDKASLQARHQQRRATLEALTTEYESAAARFDANEMALDREHAGIKQRQGMIDLRKQEYREILARCQDAACIEGQNTRRDAINADQMALNRDIDAYNARMDQRESDAAKLDMMEAHLGELRDELSRLEQDITRR